MQITSTYMAHSDYSNSSRYQEVGPETSRVSRYQEVGPKTQNILTVLSYTSWVLSIKLISFKLKHSI